MSKNSSNFNDIKVATVFHMNQNKIDELNFGKFMVISPHHCNNVSLYNFMLYSQNARNYVHVICKSSIVTNFYSLSVDKLFIIQLAELTTILDKF